MAQVLTVPVYLPTDRNLDNWLNRIVRRWLHHNAAADFTVRITPAIRRSRHNNVQPGTC